MRGGGGGGSMWVWVCVGGCVRGKEGLLSYIHLYIYVYVRLSLSLPLLPLPLPHPLTPPPPPLSHTHFLYACHTPSFYYFPPTRVYLLYIINILIHRVLHTHTHRYSHTYIYIYMCVSNHTLCGGKGGTGEEKRIEREEKAREECSIYREKAEPQEQLLLILFSPLVVFLSSLFSLFCLSFFVTVWCVVLCVVLLQKGSRNAMRMPSLCALHQITQKGNPKQPYYKTFIKKRSE